MDESKTKPEKEKYQRQYSQKQFEILNRCSAQKDMTEWNEWRKEHPDEDILLEKAAFWHAYLKGVNLKGATLQGADLQGANLEGAKLQNAVLWEAKLQGANLRETCLQGAKLMRAHLQGAEFGRAKLHGADFSRAVVDGGTLIWDVKVDPKTKFEGVVLDAARIYPEDKQLLEYNVRRMNWEEWYKNKDEPIRHGVGIFSNQKLRLTTNRLLRCLVRKFWEISDYGISTKQIIKTFFALAVIFAAVYLAWGLIDYHIVGLKDKPGIVSNLFVLEGEKEAVSPWLVPFRSIYFSIVTMTTLGFSDMYASTHGFFRGLFGHLFLALQVILGYVLLGALVTRFAVLFTAGGPAGKFADDKK